MITLFHGSRTEPEKVLENGLLVGGIFKGKTVREIKEQMRDRVLKEFNLKLSDIPSWTWEGELRYEEDRKPHLHFSINLETAIGYSHQGCETMAQIRHAILLVLNGIEDKTYSEIDRGLMLKINKLSWEGNGKNSYVYKIKVPENFIDPESLGWLKKLKKKTKEFPEYRRILSTTATEIRVNRDVPPEFIKKVFKIHFLDDYGFKYKWSEII